MQEWMDIAVSLTTLTLLEVVLGIDNLVFISILSQKLPKHQQAKARKLGLTFAWVTRLILLSSALWLSKLTNPLFSVGAQTFSGRDLFLIAGGAFLIAKTTQEIHQEIEPTPIEKHKPYQRGHFWMVIAQIGLLDIIFSLDSVITAVGLTDKFWVMAVAITIAILMMIFASEPLSRFIERHQTVKMLALAFLLLIGTVLIADGFSFHVPRGYVYFAMGFSLLVESLNYVKTKRVKSD